MRRLCIVLRFVFWQQQRRKCSLKPVAEFSQPPEIGRLGQVSACEGVTVFVSRSFPAYVRSTYSQARNEPTTVLVAIIGVEKFVPNLFSCNSNSFSLSAILCKINFFVFSFFKNEKKILVFHSGFP